MNRQLLILCVLAAAGGCQDATAPYPTPPPQFAQGGNGVWTVNNLDDPGDGVCDDAHCTLREAIAAATSGGTIVFANGLQGTIQLTAGELQLEKSVSIDGAGLITVDAQGNSRVMRGPVVDPGGQLDIALAGLTLTNGYSPGFGGGLLMSFAAATLDNVHVIGNRADLGAGGIAAVEADVTIRNSVLSDNDTGGEGGAIYTGGNAHVIVVESTISGNMAGTNGGGVKVFTNSTLQLVASTISANVADQFGGGIHVSGGAAASIMRSTISGNGAASQGGGVFVEDGGSAELRSTTVTRNSAASIGALLKAGLDGTLGVANSIVAGNSPADDECDGLVGSHGYNLATVGGACPFNATGDVKVADNVVFAEVLAQSLADNGGPTKTHALIIRGRAVDAGSCPGETTDQRGLPRPIDDPLLSNATGGGCDVGAYEQQGPVVPIADLMVSLSTDKTNVKQGDLLTYFVRVQNLGPETAPDVVVTNVLSSGVTFVSAQANKGALTAPPAGETGTVTWNLGDMVDHANEVAEIVVTVIVRGRTAITNTASATGDVVDPNPANNMASITTSVGAGAGGGKPKKN
jgi:uncharacterized repeat protein (TIGR01451 family)/CSLREA domain-containing protein